jgi:hypothetical protein
MLSEGAAFFARAHNFSFEQKQTDERCSYRLHFANSNNLFIYKMKDVFTYMKIY